MSIRSTTKSRTSFITNLLHYQLSYFFIDFMSAGCFLQRFIQTARHQHEKSVEEKNSTRIEKHRECTHIRVFNSLERGINRYSTGYIGHRYDRFWSGASQLFEFLIASFYEKVSQATSMLLVTETKSWNFQSNSIHKIRSNSSLALWNYRSRNLDESSPWRCPAWSILRLLLRWRERDPDSTAVPVARRPSPFYKVKLWHRRHLRQKDAHRIWE